jgi:predicted lipoprotein with Yx(FWY)xxD motif
MRLLVTAALAALVLGATAQAADMQPRLVRTIMDAQLGEVLTKANKQAIYTWNQERGGKVRCYGACAKAWPPVLVRTGVRVPMHVEGIMGDFGTVRRRDGTRQLTLDRRPLYTYADEKPGQVLCNNVNGWFAVKVHA